MEEKQCREDELSSSSEESEIIIQKMREEISSLKEEVNNLRAAKEDADIKLELMRERFEEDIISLKDVHLDTFIKNTGAKQYLDKLRNKDKIKDELIERLKDQAQQKDNELARLRSKLSQLEKKNEDCSRRLVELEDERRNSHSSIIDRRISPPPPVNMSNLLQELSMINPQEPMHHSYNHTTSDNRSLTSPMPTDCSFSDIPPPPPIELQFK